MQYLAAYALASLSGKEPTADQVTNILKATGQNVDAKEVNAVVDKLRGKKIEDVIKAGISKVGSAGSGPAPAVNKKQQAKKPAESKKKAPEPEPAAEEEEEGMGGLFD